jgi:hypothetical protein
MRDINDDDDDDDDEDNDHVMETKKTKIMMTKMMII